RAVRPIAIARSEEGQAVAVAAAFELELAALASGRTEHGHDPGNRFVDLGTGHGGDTRGTQDARVAVGAVIEQHLQERGKVPRRPRDAVRTPVEFVELRRIDAAMHAGKRRRAWHALGPIDSPVAQLGRKSEVRVVHAEWLEEARLRELPEGLAA